MLKTFITYREAALRVGRARAVAAGMLAIFSYPHAAEAQYRPDAQALASIASRHPHLTASQKGKPLNIFVNALVAPAFLSAQSKYYGCLPDSGQVDDGTAPTGSGIRMFVSLTHGSDANDGLTKATAKQTLTAVLAAVHNSFKALQQPPTGSTIPDGSRIYFCRGDVWDGAISIKGSASSPPTSNYFFGCYTHTGDGPKPRPKIRYKNFNIAGGSNVSDCFHIAGFSGSPVVGPTAIQNIDFDGLNTVSFFYSGLTGGTPTIGDVVTCTRTACTATLSDIMPVSAASYIACQGFILPGTGATSIDSGIKAGDTVTSNTGWSATVGTVIYTNGFFCSQAINVTMQFSSVVNCTANGISPNGFGTTTAANYVFRHIYLQDCQTVLKNGAGIGGGSGTGIAYDHITVITCGRDPVFSHGAYIVGGFSPTTLTNSYVYGSANNGITEHGGGQDFSVTDNFLDSNGNGMGFGPGFATGTENVVNGIIARNIIINSGQRAPYNANIAFGTGLGISCWINGLVQNNLIVNSLNFGMLLDSDVASGETQNSLTVYNNTIDAPAGAYALYIRAKHGTSAHAVSYDIRNNIISNADASLFALVKDVNELIPLASVTLDGNHYYMKNKATSPSVGSIIQWDSTAYTLSAFHTFDATKETTQNYGDPQFINPVSTTTGSLPNGKKCGGTYRQVSAGKKTGVSIGVTSDLNGNPRSAQNPGCYA